MKELLHRLRSNIDVKGPEDCWNWLGGKKSGYGRISVNGYAENVTRVIYRLVYGSLLVDEVVMHSCDNPSCCNPKHLKAGSRRENAEQRDLRGRREPPIGTKNGRALVDEEFVRKVRLEYLEGFQGGITYRKLANRYQVKLALIANIVNRRTWKHIQ